MLLDVGDQSFVDVLHDPVEELGVDMFGQSVPSVGGLNAGEGLDIRLCGRLQLPVAKPLRHVLIGHANQLAECRQVAIVGLRGGEDTFYVTVMHIVSSQSCRWSHFLTGMMLLSASLSFISTLPR